MRKLILALLLLSGSAFAQGVIGNGLWQFVWAAPSGACSASAQPQLVVGTGTVYTCQSATWALVGPGGSGSFTAGGDLSGTTSSQTVIGLNNTNLAGLGTGILKNTTGTGVPSIAVAGDFPTLNQNTSGTASNVSGTPALPSGTTATTQVATDNSTKLQTTAGSKASSFYTWNCHVSFATNSGSNSESCQWTLPAALTITSIEAYVVTASSGCGTTPSVSLFNFTDTAIVGSFTLALSTSHGITPVTGTTNVASGKKLGIALTTPSATCTTQAAGIDVTVLYQVQ